ncbi:putative LSU ribosomal protein L18P [Cardiosporidium cionae]|uniref:LSU ribosomal protein L18P n=1 Tax=Cardiosporidium cionae TaxID=476202 RepID=A0ABQ7JCR3_9APIC|nr:putative LSU ribosomal protein L18P [Cardiosporidium cionae]|eukprot:KAF8821715.1 putative LSU ribosomal protein L18P [Cardiosporidium cionae]
MNVILLSRTSGSRVLWVVLYSFLMQHHLLFSPLHRSTKFKRFPLRWAIALLVSLQVSLATPAGWVNILTLSQVPILYNERDIDRPFHIPMSSSRKNLVVKLFEYSNPLSRQKTSLCGAKKAPPPKKKKSIQTKSALKSNLYRKVKKNPQIPPMTQQNRTSGLAKENRKRHSQPSKLNKNPPPWAHIFEENVEPAPLGTPPMNMNPLILHGKFRPRLTIKKTNNHLYCALVNDEQQHTLCFAATKCPEMNPLLEKMKRRRGKVERNHGNTVKAAWELGKLMGRKILSKGIQKICYDRAGYRYHGKVAAIADGARAVGVQF